MLVDTSERKSSVRVTTVSRLLSAVGVVRIRLVDVFPPGPSIPSKAVLAANIAANDATGSARSTEVKSEAKEQHTRER